MKNNQCNFFYLIFIVLFASCQKEILPIHNIDIHNVDKQSTVINLNNGDIPTNPYYTIDSIGKQTQFFNEHPSGAKEKDRLYLTFTPTDFLPTGLYASINDTINLIANKIEGTTLPKLLIGTYARYGVHYTPQEVQLTEGLNTIISKNTGLLWIRYGTANTPISKSKLIFSTGTKVAPTFVKNKTTQVAFEAMINNSDTTIKDILFVGQNTYTVLPKSTSNFQTQNNNYVITQQDKAWDSIDRFSGLDGSNEIHMPTKIPHLLTICDPPYSGAFANNYVTGYSYISNFFDNTSNTFWFQRHELGHAHQQRWDWHAEILADIYAVTVGINWQMPTDQIARDNAWRNLWTRVKDYLNMPASEKDYSNIWAQNSIQNIRFICSAMAIQLKYAYGDKLFQDFHKAARHEKPSLANKDVKLQYFMKKMCVLSGYDLSDFFKKWGFNYNSTYDEIAALNLPKPIVEPHLLTDTYNPTLENGAIYQIQTALNTNKVLDVNSNSPANNTLVSLWSKHNPAANNQKFLARAQNDGSYVFKSVADTTKVLSTLNGLITNGTQLAVHDYDGSNNQKWTPQKITDHLYKIKSHAGPNSYIDVAGSTTTNGTKIIIYGSNNGNNQKFKFVKQ